MADRAQLILQHYKFSFNLLYLKGYLKYVLSNDDKCNIFTINMVCVYSQQTSGANSKLVMCDLTNIGISIGDTEDRGLLTISGFDLGAFSVIRNLAQDLIW